MVSVELGMLGTLFLVTALAIALWQRRAARCTRHRRAIGVAAWLLAAGCVLAGLFLLLKGIDA